MWLLQNVLQMSQEVQSGLWMETGTQWEVFEVEGWGCLQAFKTQNRWFSVAGCRGGVSRESREASAPTAGDGAGVCSLGCCLRVG